MNPKPKSAKPDSFIDTYLPAMLGRAAHLISAEFHKVALAHGISVTEWRVLGCLADGQTFNIGQLATLALTKQPTLTRLLARMEARGEIERKDAVEDKRITLVRLTPKGGKLARKLVGLAQDHEEKVMAELGFHGSHDLKRVVQQLIDLHSHALSDSDEESPDQD